MSDFCAALVTFENSGGGFLPRHKLDKHQTAFRVIERRPGLLSNLKTTDDTFELTVTTDLHFNKETHLWQMFFLR